MRMETKIKIIFLNVFFLFGIIGCEQDTTYIKTLSDADTYRMTMKQLTDVIVYDIFSPPVASRIYAYSNVAAYEVLALSQPAKLNSLSGQLNELAKADPPDNEINPHLASIHAFLTVGKAFTFSEKKLSEFQTNFYEKLTTQGLPDVLKEESLAYGEYIGNFILKWANEDMYKQTRSFPKYTVRDETKYWKPTPPDYMEGIEPHWNKIRPMVLKSADQFIPKEPEPFSMNKTSEFFNQLNEVYEVGRNLDEEQTEIARFWDCNPYASSHRGHAMFATKKITPGGHWIGITSIASKQAGSSFTTTVAAFTQTSIALFDGFISCWDEKWRSLLVRPETLINQYMDEDWKPLLQTPPFPEYTSGHSVISRAAAVALTAFYGPDFKFHDTTEVEFGLTARDFKSFLEASEEAAISRLYGGIHYRMAIINGVDQGEDVGNWIINNLETIKE